MGYVARTLDKVTSEENISQAELARATTISRPTINKLFHENTDLRPEWAVQIGYALDIDPKKLFFGEGREKLEEARSQIEIGSVTRLVD